MAISAACINNGGIIPSALSNYYGKELILFASVPECALLRRRQAGLSVRGKKDTQTKKATRLSGLFRDLVAGAGFEPTTFGL